jgi:hypothetical protein
MSDRYQIAVQNLRNNYAKIRQARKEKQIKLIDFAEVKKAQNLPGKKKPVAEVAYCQATTMSGKRCRFKATCGCFCKKHKL